MELNTYLNEGNRIVGRYVWSLRERPHGTVLESKGTYLILDNGDKLFLSQWRDCRTTQPLTE